MKKFKEIIFIQHLFKTPQLAVQVGIIKGAGFIFALGFLVYFFSLGNQFLWDDEEQIVQNTAIHNIKNLPSLFTKGIVYIPGRELSGGFYRPIVSLTHMLLYLIANGSPFAFRLFQITLHAINGVLVFLLFLNLLREKNASFLLSAIFAIHPAISEGVLFISGLGEPIYFFFLITAFLLFLAYEKSSKRKKVVFYLLSLLFFLFALLTKEAAVVLFLLIIFYVLLFHRERSRIPIVLGYFWTILGYILLRVITVGGLAVNLNFPSLIGQASTFTRFLTIPYSVTYYILIFLFPLNLATSNQTVVNSTNISFWLPVLFILLTILLIYYFYRKTKSKVFIFFVFWFFVSIMPILNLVPLSSTVAERWLYSPIIGILGAATVLGINFYPKVKTYKKIISIALILYVGLLSLRTIIRTFDWRNGYSLYKQDILTNPNSFELQNNYGVELFRKGETVKSKQYFQKSVELNPKWWPNFNNLGVVYEREGDYKTAQELYQKSIDNGDYFLAYGNLAKIYLKTKDYDNANKILQTATGYFPNNPALHRFYAISLYQTGQYEFALKESQILVKLEPSQENYNLWQLISKKEKLPEL